MIRYIPLLCLVIFIAAFAKHLLHEDSGVLPSHDRLHGEGVVGTYLPSFAFDALYEEQSMTFTPAAMQGRISLLNMFASWCLSCVQEHKVLAEIKRKYELPIYGIAWKDKEENTRSWLERNGKIYSKVGMDNEGMLGVELGMTGVPETYVLSPLGKIMAVFRGPLTMRDFETHLLPAIELMQGK